MGNEGRSVVLVSAMMTICNDFGLSASDSSTLIFRCVCDDMKRLPCAGLPKPRNLTLAGRENPGSRRSQGLLASACGCEEHYHGRVFIFLPIASCPRSD